MSKVLKKAGRPVYLCSVQEDIESVLQGVDPALLVVYSTIQEAEQKLKTSC